MLRVARGNWKARWKLEQWKGSWTSVALARPGLMASVMQMHGLTYQLSQDNRDMQTAIWKGIYDNSYRVSMRAIAVLCASPQLLTLGWLALTQGDVSQKERLMRCA